MDNPVFDFAQLIVRIGLVMAKNDGAFDASERIFIQSFSTKLLDQNIIDNEMQEALLGLYGRQETIESVLADIKTFMAPFNDLEKSKIKQTIDGFLLELMNADGVIAPEEVEVYNKWKSLEL